MAEASGVPVILYSVPANTAIDLSADVIVRLARHQNIIALKDSAGDVSNTIIIIIIIIIIINKTTHNLLRVM